MANRKQEDAEIELDEGILAQVIQTRLNNEELSQTFIKLENCIRKVKSYDEVGALNTGSEREASIKMLNTLLLDILNKGQIKVLNRCLVKLHQLVDLAEQALSEIRLVINSSPKEGFDHNLDLNTEKMEDSGTNRQESGDNNEATKNAASEDLHTLK